MENKRSKIISFEGLIAAPFTPFRENGEVDNSLIDKYAEHLHNKGVRGVFVNGTTGEGLSLTVEERKIIAEKWVKAAVNRLDVVIIQVGANSIKDARELASHAETVGATGIASLPPLFYKPKTIDHLVTYLKSIAEAAPKLPFMLYHIPSYSGVNFKFGDFLKEAKQRIPTFCGAKYTSEDIRELSVAHTVEGNLKIMSGLDEILLQSMDSGVTAAVGATYNFMAPLSLRIISLYKEKNMAAAKVEQKHVLEIIEAIVEEGQGIAALKAAMNIIGPLNFGKPRLPLIPLTEKQCKTLGEKLSKFGLCN